ncbi:c-type cytochrome [Thioclava sp.]|uniref:c-type cytochrome n=1 Tax=Thioclava sp. TaxID=1933450 RepID=UPI003AA7FE42
MSEKNDFPDDFNDAVRDADERFEPHELKNPIPWPLIAIAVALAVWSGATLFLDARATEEGSDAQMARDAEAQGTAPVETSPADQAAAKNNNFVAEGAALFETYCATCHQLNGSGVRGAIPPLDGSRYVLAEPRVPAAIVLRGIAGPIEVKGHLYNGRMPTFHATLSDEQIARILTYVRGAWSNDAGDLAGADVAQVRTALGADLSQPWRDGFALENRYGVSAATPQSGEDKQ